MTQALGTTKCFTNFLAESRTSTSITATLKDFATPEDGFNVCSIAVNKACTSPRLNLAEDKIIYDITGTVHGSGGGGIAAILLGPGALIATVFIITKELEPAYYLAFAAVVGSCLALLLPMIFVFHFGGVASVVALPEKLLGEVEAGGRGRNGSRCPREDRLVAVQIQLVTVIVIRIPADVRRQRGSSRRPE